MIMIHHNSQSTTTILLFLVKFTDGARDSFIKLFIHLIRNDAGDNKVSRDVDHCAEPGHEPTENDEQRGQEQSKMVSKEG